MYPHKMPYQKVLLIWCDDNKLKRCCCCYCCCCYGHLVNVLVSWRMKVKKMIFCIAIKHWCLTLFYTICWFVAKGLFFLWFTISFHFSLFCTSHSLSFSYSISLWLSLYLTPSFLPLLWSISSTYYKQLLCSQIPKVQKDIDDLTVFLHFWDLSA